MSDDQNEFEITYVMPGGVCVTRLGTGYKTVRIGKGILENKENGLIAEMDKAEDLVPWKSKEARDEALRELKSARYLEKSLKYRLIRHVLVTPYFGPTEPPLAELPKPT